MSAEYRLRPVREDDLPTLVDIFFEAAEELNARFNLTPTPRAASSGLSNLFGHLVRTEPELAWLAEEARSGDVVGFGIAVRREHRWFLSFLFIHPAHQGRRVGRSILERLLPSDRPDPLARPAGVGSPHLATVVESHQPVSTALYSGFGMVPRVPLYALIGRMAPGSMPPLPTALTRVPFAQAVEAGMDLAATLEVLDRATVGYARPIDHGFWQGMGRQGFVYRAGDTAVGYGYGTPAGRIGPVAVLEAELLPALVGDVAEAAGPPVDAWMINVAGEARPTLVALLRAGMRFEGTPAIYSATEPGPAFERYLPASFALL